MSEAASFKAQDSMKSCENAVKAEILARVNAGYKIASYQKSKREDPSSYILSNDGESDFSEMCRKMSENKFVVEILDTNAPLGQNMGLSAIKEPQIRAKIAAKINEITATYGYSKMLYGSNLGDFVDLDSINAMQKVEFNKPIEKMRNEVFSAEFSVISAFCGVSSHGIACVFSSKEQPRMLSLAPSLCIVLLPKVAILKSQSAALNLLKERILGNLDSIKNDSCGSDINKANCDLDINKANLSAQNNPANVLFIAGPSRTADIELITVFGVHGSQKVHIVLY